MKKVSKILFVILTVLLLTSTFFTICSANTPASLEELKEQRKYDLNNDYYVSKAEKKLLDSISEIESNITDLQKDILYLKNDSIVTSAKTSRYDLNNDSTVSVAEYSVQSMHEIHNIILIFGLTIGIILLLLIVLNIISLIRYNRLKKLLFNINSNSIDSKNDCRTDFNTENNIILDHSDF